LSTAGVSGLLVISMIALAAPVLAAGVQRARVPDVVVEIVAGIVVGPSVLGWVKIDQPVGLVALLGLAFLLFLAGLEVDLKVITPSRLRAPLAGYAASLLLGSPPGSRSTPPGGSAARCSSPSRCRPAPWDSSCRFSSTPSSPGRSLAS
jgi:sodium/hydrogen exchanger family protein